MTPRQCKMARVGLGLTAAQLAQMASVGTATVNRFEGEQGRTIPSTITAMQRALEDAGVIFLAAGETADGGPGVRLKATA